MYNVCFTLFRVHVFTLKKRFINVFHKRLQTFRKLFFPGQNNVFLLAGIITAMPVKRVVIFEQQGKGLL